MQAASPPVAASGEGGRGRWVSIPIPPRRKVGAGGGGGGGGGQRRIPPSANNSRRSRPRRAAATEEENGGLVGLANLGNTCFLGCGVQVLSFSAPLRRYLLHEDDGFARELHSENPLGTRGEVTAALVRTLRQLWTAPKLTAVEPRLLKLVLARHRAQFGGNQQHDAQELLAVLLDALHEDLNRARTKPPTTAAEARGRADSEVAREQWALHRTRDDSVVVDLFTGLLKSSLRFDCQRVSTTFDPYTSLSLPIPKEKTIHADITVVWDNQNDDEASSWRQPTKYCVEFERDRQVASASTSPSSSGDSASSTPHSASSSLSASASDSNAPGPSTSRPGLASSLRVGDVKAALGRLCGVPSGRLLLTRLQVAPKGMRRLLPLLILNDFQSLTEFSLANQAAAGPQGDENDCYIAFELPKRPKSIVVQVDVPEESLSLRPESTVAASSSVPSALDTSTVAPSSTLDVATTSVTAAGPSPSASPAALLFHTTTPSTGVAPSPSPTQPTHPTSYGGLGGSVRLGMKFDVRDSVARWEIATVQDIRVLVTARSMHECGGRLEGDAVVPSTAKPQGKQEEVSENSIVVRFTGTADVDQDDEERPRVLKLPTSSRSPKPPVILNADDDELSQSFRTRFHSDASMVGNPDVDAEQDLDADAEQLIKDAPPMRASPSVDTAAEECSAVASTQAREASVNDSTTRTRRSVTTSLTSGSSFPSQPAVPPPKFTPSAWPHLVYQHVTEVPRRLSADQAPVQLMFTFDGFSARWDEWVDLASTRIAPYGSGLVKTFGRASITPGCGGSSTGALAATHPALGMTASIPSDLDLEPGWIRVQCMQRVLGPVTLATTIDVGAPSSSPDVSLPPSADAAPSATPPSAMEFFTVPLLLWLDPRHTTYEQLYERVWSKLKRFTKLPDSLPHEEVEEEQAVPEEHYVVSPLPDADADADAPSSDSSDAAALPASDGTTVAASAEVALSSSSSSILAPVAPVAPVAAAVPSASRLPACFSQPSTAPFVLRWSSRGGSACSRCIGWNNMCLGCAIDLDAPAAVDPLGENDPAPAPVAPASTRDSFLVRDSYRRSTREWLADTSLCVDWNVDYFTAGLVDLRAMQALELDASVVARRAHLLTEGKVDLAACLEMFTTSERLDGDAMVYCSACKTHEPATKTLALHSTPPLLVLHLKRLMPDAKLYTNVEFPLEGFDPTPFLARRTPKTDVPQPPPAEEIEQEEKKEPIPDLPEAALPVEDASSLPSEPAPAAAASPSPLYDLYGVINHFGSVGGGHYVAYCRGPSGSWWRFDDSRVSAIPASSVVSSSAYMLFYTKRGLSPDHAVDATPAAARTRPLDRQAKRLVREAEADFPTACSPVCAVQ